MFMFMFIEDGVVLNGANAVGSIKIVCNAHMYITYNNKTMYFQPQFYIVHCRSVQLYV